MCSTAVAGGGRAMGCVAVLVKNTAVHGSLNIGAALQAVAVRVALRGVISICSICIPPGQRLFQGDLDHLLAQLPAPFLLLGDFNARGPLWGGGSVDGGGEVVEEFLGNHGLCFFGDGSDTYLRSGHGTCSAVDLSVCHPELFLDCAWSVRTDLCGGDHCRVILSSGGSVEDGVPKWNFCGASWSTFSERCQEGLLAISTSQVDGPAAVFADVMVGAADSTVPETSSNPSRPFIPWSGPACKKAILE